MDRRERLRLEQGQAATPEEGVEGVRHALRAVGDAALLVLPTPRRRVTFKLLLVSSGSSSFILPRFLAKLVSVRHEDKYAPLQT